jgi:1-aminocyclopropane-1-carboxylate deaminase/D-cysteine desulfhydrase-like pyridoxal-dependent ACC family enzyme
VAQGYHEVIASYPRLRLATLPTPLERAHRLEARLRAEGARTVPRLHLKRDDLLSLGLGGNKVRNLEFLLGQALAEGATDVVTAGRQQSNHCRLTAAACARAGLRCHLVLSGVEPPRATGNLLLDGLFGAEVRFVGSDDRAERSRVVDQTARAIDDRGGRSFVIGVGGSDTRGAVGHLLLAEELVAQLPSMRAVVLATATGGTQTGLVTGLSAMAHGAAVYGFAVAKTAAELRDDVARLCVSLAEDLGLEAMSREAINIDGSVLGLGYGVPTDAGAAAIGLLAQSEGVVLDPVYTGKGFAGLLSMVRAGGFGADDDVVFLHTGGAPALFADLT